jgi:hypothetical protein
MTQQFGPVDESQLPSLCASRAATDVASATFSQA